MVALIKIFQIHEVGNAMPPVGSTLRKKRNLIKKSPPSGKVSCYNQTFLLLYN